VICPSCGTGESRVIDSRMARDGSEIRRRRECLECGRRFTTRERMEESMPRVVKRDERREEYDRAKVLAGIQRACTKRPVSQDAVELMVDRLEKRLVELGDGEVPSRLIGEVVMRELTAVDHVAAARFASVFLGFQGPEDYRKFFASVAEGREPDPGSRD